LLKTNFNINFCKPTAILAAIVLVTGSVPNVNAVFETSVFPDAYYIPDWIKHNARWWSDSLISDDEFLRGINFLIDSRIIILDTLKIDILNEFPSNEIPNWVKFNAKTWADGSISNGEFIDGIKHLISIGLVNPKMGKPLAENYFSLTEQGSPELNLSPEEEQQKITDFLIYYDARLAVLDPNINPTEEQLQYYCLIKINNLKSKS